MEIKQKNIVWAFKGLFKGPIMVKRAVIKKERTEIRVNQPRRLQGPAPEPSIQRGRSGDDQVFVTGVCLGSAHRGLTIFGLGCGRGWPCWWSNLYLLNPQYAIFCVESLARPLLT